MKTSLDCMPCFMKMALRDARLACPGDEAMHQSVIAAWGRKIGDLDLNEPPPALAYHLSEVVRSVTGCGDLYAEDKEQANTDVAALLPSLSKRIRESRDRGADASLALALELAIIGNFIDRGVELSFDFEKEVAGVSESIPSELLQQFSTSACDAARVLILGDNAGEIVLDTLLVEELVHRGCDVTYAVRSKPVINDATMADAECVGMTKLCAVVESGVDTPGTVLERCTSEFLDLMRQADVVLSKGQGNFEALEERWPGIFCAFKVKCKRISERVGLPIGQSAFCMTSDQTSASADKGK